MPQPKIVTDENPAKELRDAILRPLMDYNDSKAGPSNYVPFALFIRDPESDDILGGLWAHSAYDWMFVELIIVPEKLRGTGLGSRLIRQAEATAAARGCTGIWLDTFSFQARGFYEKLGYELFGSIDNYPKNGSRFFFRKQLPQRDA